jgi:hypothetical protein
MTQPQMNQRPVSPGDMLAWSVARWAATLPRMTTFAASTAALAGLRLAQERLGAKPALWGHGGAYDPRGEVALYRRTQLFNRSPRARLGLPAVLETLSRGNRLLATPAQVDGAANANLSVIGEWGRPKVAMGGTRGLPDATEIHFVLPAHSPRQLVARVDFVSTAAASRQVPPCLFTELGVLRWWPERKAWRLSERHVGVTLAQVQERTGFAVLADGNVPEIPPLPEHLLPVLDQVDPRRLRDLDFVTSVTQRQQRLAEIEAAETRACGNWLKPGIGGS